MFIRRIAIENLGNSSYLVGSQEESVAAVIDPVRDVDLYITAAEAMGVRILYAFETHIHNDFVSGARELAAQTGAKVCAGASGGLVYPHIPLKDGDTIELGKLSISALHTPGHTTEHMAYTISESGKAGGPAAVFTGGALIPGGAARIDLMGDQVALFLGRWLYNSLSQKLLSLPDDVVVYPTHAGGSFCSAGPAPQNDGETTIGKERQYNPLLQAHSEASFLELALSGLGTYPAYFKMMSYVNRAGPKVLGSLPRLFPLSPQEVMVRMESKGVAPIDARNPATFADSHLPGSYSIPFGSSFATWVRWVVPWQTPLVIVSDGEQSHHEMVRHLIRIGYDQIECFLEGGVAAWREKGYPLAAFTRLPLDDFHNLWTKGEAPLLLDVRQRNEWEAFHIPGTLNIELGALQEHLEGLPLDLPLATMCAAGARASTAASILQREGRDKVLMVEDGAPPWEKRGYPVEHGAGAAS